MSYYQGFAKGVQVWCSPPLEKFSCKKSQRGDQRKFFELNSEMFLKNISFGPLFEISIEFRQKS
jgi:hypothetical protein